MRLFPVVLLMIFTVSISTADIKFLKVPLADAIKKAEAEKKPVMIDFITDWCRWCDTLDARTYSDSSVAGFVNGNVVPIKIDAEKGEGIDIAKKYSVSAYPTILLIKANGEEIDRMLGYVPPQPFLTTLQDYVQGKNTIGVLTTRLKENPTDPSLRYQLAKKHADRYDMAAAGEHFQKLLALDPNNSLGHNEEAQFTVGIAALRSAKDPSKLVAFTDAYQQSSRIREALSSLVRFYGEQKDGENTKKYFLRYMEQWPTDAAMMNNYAWSCAEQQINLDEAADIAKKAVELAPKAGQKAGYLDTYAAVKFAQGKIDEAIALEQQAIDLLKSVPSAKTKHYEESMAKFRAAKTPTSPH